ncbi:class I glutamine amidotransferase-like protein [Crepidotus variabilis]|uniref:Class I glutamine amidotransferase-like protein n=1 Tax=Crepidotus variabilis TaxID=179855 RepID=A0A9P6JNS3_9AGAR|nr:class I glutamine amidotransferase-like protein [Crepidotus variabilis]
MPEQRTLSMGLLMLPGFQNIDAVGSVDWINSHSQDFLKALNLPSLLPAQLIAKAPIMKWHYISHSLEPVQASSGPLQTPTTTYAKCPKLDYLIVPGPDPFTNLPNGCGAFLTERFKELKGLFLVCTASIAIARSIDILDGYKITSNKAILKDIVNTPRYQELRKVKWVADKRWVVDGKVWSAAGVVACLDLAAELVRREVNAEVVETIKNMAQVTARSDTPDEFAYLLKGVQF